jgi:hypothetical protein
MKTIVYTKYGPPGVLQLKDFKGQAGSLYFKPDRGQSRIYKGFDESNPYINYGFES